MLGFLPYLRQILLSTGNINTAQKSRVSREPRKLLKALSAGESDPIYPNNPKITWPMGAARIKHTKPASVLQKYFKKLSGLRRRTFLLGRTFV